RAPPRVTPLLLLESASSQSPSRDSYWVTDTVTLSLPNSAPSSANAFNVYVPDSAKVACTTILPSLGITGGVHNGAHGEFMPARVSSQDFTCSGVNVTLPEPR